jgi:1-pyrroline-5-carboxylate dehydrogenase
MRNKFANESTYERMSRSGNEAEFDRLFDEAATLAKKSFNREHPMHIGGRQVLTEEKLVEVSPIDRGTVIGKFQKGTAESAKLAISEAASALADWSGTDYRERVEIFRKAASLLSERKFEVAAILSYENGKTRYESVGEVDEGIDFMRYYAMEVETNKGYARKTGLTGTTPKETTGFQGAASGSEKIRVALRPYGVFGIIAPFNFPVSISIGMSTGALITGNTVVFKPSSSENMTMLSGIRIYELFKEAGVPSGAFNYITGMGTLIGDEMLHNDSVKGIAFTGSRSAGTSLIVKAALYGKMKQLVLEMGGKNPAIVSRSADLDTAANGIASAAFGYAGQKCSALSRLYVHESIKEALVGKLIEKARNMKIGNPLNKEVYVGPLIGEPAMKRYREIIASARTAERVLYGGNEVKTGLNGFYVEPTIIDAKHTSELVKRELFLPILTVETFKDINEAIRLANDTPYGLTAGFYTKKRSEIKEFASKIEAGVLYINREVSATTGAMVGVHAFVGWKDSGFTGKGTGSRFYLQQFMREQSVSLVQ